MKLSNSPLGKSSAYIDKYDASILFSIPRINKRQEIGIDSLKLPFYGNDIWHAYEISFLNTKGKPIVACGEFSFPCTSKNIIESKSLKLYLNSFNNSKFKNLEEVANIISIDLAKAIDSKVKVELFTLADWLNKYSLGNFIGTNLDSLDIICQDYVVNTNLLSTVNDTVVHEVLYSNLLKSNCLVTGQPDWGTVCIEYSGNKICHENLLKYLISFRNHNEFHEQCVERIFNDIWQKTKPEKLSVEARYTRRGGLDICPFRTSLLTLKRNIASNILIRQ